MPRRRRPIKLPRRAVDKSRVGAISARELGPIEEPRRPWTVFSAKRTRGRRAGLVAGLAASLGAVGCGKPSWWPIRPFGSVRSYNQTIVPGPKGHPARRDRAPADARHRPGASARHDRRRDPAGLGRLIAVSSGGRPRRQGQSDSDLSAFRVVPSALCLSLPQLRRRRRGHGDDRDRARDDRRVQRHGQGRRAGGRRVRVGVRAERRRRAERDPQAELRLVRLRDRADQVDPRRSPAGAGCSPSRSAARGSRGGGSGPRDIRPRPSSPGRGPCRPSSAAPAPGRARP